MFVGPFSNKLDGPSDVITLDDDDEDEVQLVTDDDNLVVSPKNPPPPFTPEQRMYSREVRAQAVTAQVPQVVARGDEDEDIVDESPSYTPPSVPRRRLPEYLNLRQSQWGTVVIVPTDGSSASRDQQHETSHIIVPNYGSQELWVYGPDKVRLTASIFRLMGKLCLLCLNSFFCLAFFSPRCVLNIQSLLITK